MGESELEWIVNKASELLYDKAEEGPLKEGDVELAYSMFAEPRLAKILKSFESEEEQKEVVSQVKKMLQEVAIKLNRKLWKGQYPIR